MNTPKIDRQVFTAFLVLFLCSSSTLVWAQRDSMVFAEEQTWSVASKKSDSVLSLVEGRTVLPAYVNRFDFGAQQASPFSKQMTIFPYYLDAAALPLSSLQQEVPQFGYAQLQVIQHAGKFHRPMQPEQAILPSASTGGVFKRNGWQWIGHFQYGRAYDRNLAWSGVKDPYNGNPFIWSDSLSGNWERDDVSARLAFVTPEWKKWKFSHDILYNIGVGARRNEPKPFYRNRHLQLAPTLSYTFSGGSSLAITGKVQWGKEENEIGFFSNDNVLLYRQRGFGTFQKSPFVNGERKQLERTLGAAAHYLWQRNLTRWWLSGYVQQREDVVSEGVAFPKETGYFTGIDYGASLQAYRGNAINGWKISGIFSIADGYADDVGFQAETAFSRQLKGQVNGQFWQTKAHHLHQINVRVGLDWMQQQDAGTFTTWEVNLFQSSIEYLWRFPYSKKGTISFNPALSFQTPITKFFSSAVPTVITRALILPDYAFHQASVVTPGLSAFALYQQYQFGGQVQVAVVANRTDFNALWPTPNDNRGNRMMARLFFKVFLP